MSFPLWAKVYKYFLKVGQDDGLAAKIGNPNKKTRQMEQLIEKRKLLMKNLVKRNTDLETYMVVVNRTQIFCAEPNRTELSQFWSSAEPN